jgi:hypothetical protein
MYILWVSVNHLLMISANKALEGSVSGAPILLEMSHSRTITFGSGRAAFGLA